jgi:hypothetical protein
MSVDASLYAALMARVEEITDYPILWPQRGGDAPPVEHIRVSFLPNDNLPVDLCSNNFHRRGFLYLTLVSPLGEYEVVTRRKAGEIAALFPRALDLARDGVTVTIVGHSIRQGREYDGMWQTPIRIEYRA